MKKIISLGLVTGSLFGASIMPYGAYLKYDNSTKDKGYIGGVYISDFKSPYKFELDLEATKIKYNPVTTTTTSTDPTTGQQTTTTTTTTPSDYNQQDITLIGHKYVGYNLDYKLGLHSLFTDDSNSYIFIGGVLYYKTLDYNYGCDLYVGKYKGFNTYQLTPKGGINFGDYNSQYGSFYFEAKANIIKISKENIAPKQNYTNFDLKLQNFKGPFTTTLSVNFGKNAYKVAKDGFSVYNLGEEYKGGYELSENYKFSQTSSIKVGISKSSFNEDSNSYVYLLSYSTTF